MISKTNHSVRIMKHALGLCLIAGLFACQPIQLLPPPTQAHQGASSVQPDALQGDRSNAHLAPQAKDVADFRAPRADDVRRRAVLWAQRLLHQQVPRVHGRRFRADCSGFIEAVAYGVGLDLRLRETAKHHKGSGVDLISKYVEGWGHAGVKRPSAGDLVFFSNTYDKNRDGRINDTLTHIGVIERVYPDGRVQFIHHMRGRVQRGHLNLDRPHEHRSGELVQNTYLRRRRPRDPKSKIYTAGSLFHGYGSFVPDKKSTIY